MFDSFLLFIGESRKNVLLSRNLILDVLGEICTADLEYTFRSTYLSISNSKLSEKSKEKCVIFL